MSVVRVLSKFIALQGSVTTVRCLCRKLVHRWRSIMMFGRLYHSFCSGVKPHPTYFTSSSTMFAWLISTGSSSTSVGAASWRILNLTWLAAAKCHRCSRRFYGSIAAAMCWRFLGRFKRFAAVDGSDGVLRGFGEWLEEDPIGRFCVLNRRNYTRNGYVWNPMPDMELESLSGGGGGFVFLEGGFAKRGVRGVRPLVTGLETNNIDRLSVLVKHGSSSRLRTPVRRSR